MAVEDIPPRRVRGLGKRLEEIIESTPFYRPSAAEALYGPEPEPAEELAATDEEEVEPTTLPPPSEVIMVDQAYGSATIRRGKSKVGMSYARPDLDTTAYGQGASRSTRVWAMQWIPTSSGQLINDKRNPNSNLSGYVDPSMYEDVTFGDILVAFARPSNSQPTSLYVYSHNTLPTWEDFSSATSLGRGIKLLNGGRPYKGSDGDGYRIMHPRVSDDGWIFSADRLAMWTSPSKREVSRSGSVLSVGFLESLDELFGD